MADDVEYIGGKWNFQSDWPFLQAVKNFTKAQERAYEMEELYSIALRLGEK